MNLKACFNNRLKFKFVKWKYDSNQKSNIFSTYGILMIVVS